MVFIWGKNLHRKQVTDYHSIPALRMHTLLSMTIRGLSEPHPFPLMDLVRTCNHAQKAWSLLQVQRRIYCYIGFPTVRKKYPWLMKKACDS